jgi:hypothetical protein
MKAVYNKIIEGQTVHLQPKQKALQLDAAE